MKKKLKNDDVDFGFPFVEVFPLVREELVVTESNNLEVDMINSTSAEITTTNVKGRKSNLLLVIGILIAFLVVSAYLLYTRDLLDKLSFNKVNAPLVVNEENLSTQDTELPETQEDLKLELIEEDKTETVISESKPSIISINQRVSGRYFLVVGSLINENLANEEAEKFCKLGNDVYIIYPYGDISNYRIAIGKYDAIDLATEALEKAKKDINYSSWILKY